MIREPPGRARRFWCSSSVLPPKALAKLPKRAGATVTTRPNRSVDEKRAMVLGWVELAEIMVEEILLFMMI